ncbi:hypothetical protein FOZ62_026353, partial [Perkinsus olseni]
CEDPIDLPRHFATVEAILAEANAGSFTSGVFIPHGHLRVACVSRLVASLNPTNLRSVAEDQAQSSRWEWYAVKSSLLSQFCRRSILQKAYVTSISRLSFPGVAQCDNFLNDADRIVNLHREVFDSSSSERRVVIRAIVGKLPRDIRSLSIRAIKACRPDVNTSDAEWELMLPWRGRTACDSRSVREVIRSTCRTCEDVEAAANAFDSIPPPKHDQISYADGAGTKSSGQLEQWARRFAKAMVITGEGCQDERRTRDLLAASDVRFFRSRRGPPKLYAIACYDTEPDAVAAMSRLGEGEYKHRPFVFRSHTCTALHTGVGDDQLCSVVLNDHQHTVFLETPPELSILLDITDATLSPSAHGLSRPPGQLSGVRAVVDSGAGKSYITFGYSAHRSSESKGFHKIPTAVWVGLADGSRCSITETLSLFVTVKEPPEVTLGPVKVSVLPNHEKTSETRMLIGRDLGAALGLCLDLSTGTVRRAAIPPGEPVAEEADYIRYVEQLEAVTTAQPRLKEDQASGYLKPLLPGDVRQKAEAVVQRLVALGDFQDPALPGYRLSFRRLAHGEDPDCVEQLAALFIDLPETPMAEVRSRLYAQHAYNKLTCEQKAIYAKLIDAYVVRGFWRAVGPGGTSTHRIPLPPCPCFVTNWERKPRVVLDCRPVNRALGKVSSPRVIPWTLVLSMRLQGDLLLLQGDCEAAFYKCRLLRHAGDCEAAFYKCRLLRHAVLIQAAIGLFECVRVSFGLHFGPGLLTTGVHRVEQQIRDLIIGLWPLVNVVIRWYVDDLMMSADDAITAVAAFAVVISVLLLLGFTAQMAKVAALVHPSVLPEFGKACQQFDVRVPVKERVEILGLSASFDDQHLVLDCNRQSRWSAVDSFLSCERPTKRQAFQAAGAASYDVAQVHPIARLVSDCLRAVVGRAFSRVPWSSSYDPGGLSEPLGRAYDAILRWLKELNPKDGCSHRSLLRFSPRQEVNLVLETDASLTGAGFSLWRGVAMDCQGQLLAQQSKRAVGTMAGRPVHLHPPVDLDRNAVEPVPDDPDDTD